MRQVAVLVLVGLVASLVGAQRCSVSFSRSEDRKVTRISSKPSYSIILNEGDDLDSQWQSHTVNGHKVTTSFANGTVVERFMHELSEEEEAKLSQWRKMELEGPLFEVKDDHVVMASAGKAQMTGVRNHKRVTIKENDSDDIIAVNFAPEAPEAMSNIVQNEEIVTIVDNSCKLRTVPAKSISQ